MEVIKVAKKTHGTLTLVQATICSEKKSMFVDLDESVSGNVSFGDNYKTPIKGKGKVRS